MGQSASRIMRVRSSHRRTKARELRNIGVVVKRAVPFIKLNGWVQKMMGDYT